MITRVRFHNGQDETLVIEFPDGRMARRFIRRASFPKYEKSTEVREIDTWGNVDAILEAFNSGDDKFSRDMRQLADIKIVKTPDPGSVAGEYRG